MYRQITIKTANPKLHKFEKNTKLTQTEKPLYRIVLIFKTGLVVFIGLLKGQFRVSLGALKGQFRVSLGSLKGQFRVILGSSYESHR